ncbi:GNAT family N-acetyltransferase [Halorhabdus rudnickae]|uniref:GNAT family N-acetyltransferase n=1 Tax=Halorhabdus rudnickae TaxID=1775544 RepID=UPI0010848E00|nr:GNAT family protein [Halorhabdus rudnickae]
MPGPVFQSGDRVDLHVVAETDLEAFTRARTDPDVRLPLGIDSPGNSDTVEEFYEESVSDDDSYWFTAGVDGDLVGAVSVPEVERTPGVADLSYWILPEHRREGYGREAVSLLLEYGFEELRLHRVQADSYATNSASRGLLESLGFTEEGRMRDAAFRDGRHVDIVRYGLLATEWRDA